MPRIPLTPEEKLVRYYIAGGATEEALPKVAKRLKMTLPAVKKLLKKKAVQADLAARLAPVEREQERQELVGDAVVKATADDKQRIAELEAQLAAATQMPDLDLTEDMLDRELARLARLDGEKHGRVKLAAIQTGYVVKGITRQGRTERVMPSVTDMPQPGGGVYSAIFQQEREQRRIAAGGEPEPAPVPTTATPEPPPILDAEVFDVFPADKPAEAPKEETIPPPPPPRVPLEVLKKRVREITTPKADAVMTIEVG
jgi:hypothetical protein